MFDNSDEDFDFDLDEVVKLNTQVLPNVNSTITNSGTVPVSPKKKRDCSSSHGVDEDWGSDDDSTFLEIPEECLTQSNTIKNPTDKLNPPIIAEVLNKSSNKQPIHKSFATKNVEDVNYVKGMNLSNLPLSNNRSANKIVEPKFPGPAGLLMASSTRENGNLLARPRTTQSMTNVDGLYMWDKALSLLNITTLWNGKKLNLNMIKETFSPGVAYLRAPLLIVGIQKLELTAVIKNDIDCDFQDPTAEVKGRILKDVVVDYGKFMHTGTILVLRRPSVLQIGSTCLVTVTKTCLIGMLFSRSNEITKCHNFTKEELTSWLAEPVIYGDPVLFSNETEREPVERSPTLFTSVTATPKAHPYPHPNVSGIASPANGHRSYGSPSFNKQPRHQVNQSPRLPHGQRLPQPIEPTRSSNEPVRPPNVSNSFQFKSPSAVVTTSRTAPYLQPNTKMDAHSTPKSMASTSSQDTRDDSDTYLSQFLDGIDTDSLFDDF